MATSKSRKPSGKLATPLKKTAPAKPAPKTAGRKTAKAAGPVVKTSKTAAAKATASKASPGKPKAKASKPEAPVIIDRSFKNDRAVELRGRIPLSAATVAQLQRALLLQSIAKGDEKSTLKFYLGPSEANRYRFQDMAALADTMAMIAQPVDVIVKAGLGPDGLKAFLSATGKRFMLAGASLHMGPITSTAPYGKNKASQVRRQLVNDYKSDLQTLVIMKSGETDRTKVYRDLLSARGFSALEALAYGTTGLIDGILMGPDRVITRQDLDAFHRKAKRKPDEQSEFNKHYINVYQLPTQALTGFAPETLPAGTGSLYKSLKKEDAKKTKEKAKAVKEALKDKTKAKSSEAAEESTKPVYYLGEKKLDEYPQLVKASKDKSPLRIMIDNVPPSLIGLLYDDAIFFNDGFHDESAEQIGDALVALDHKKVRQGKPSHIKIFENSPGGSVWSGQELRSLIKSLATPVDVIVHGMGASCGSWLLCSATGNRLATPNARIMIHEAANELRDQTPHDHFNEMHDGLDQATLDYIAIVADAVGRPYEDVVKDFDNDVWLNAVESLFYGDHGLINGIIVAHDRVITRDTVTAYLRKKLGSEAKVADYVSRKLNEKRDPRLGMEWKPERHDENDPFDNPLITLAAVADQARKLSELPVFRGTLPATKDKRDIDYFNVVLEEEKK